MSCSGPDTGGYFEEFAGKMNNHFAIKLTSNAALDTPGKVREIAARIEWKYRVATRGRVVGNRGFVAA